MLHACIIGNLTTYIFQFLVFLYLIVSPDESRGYLGLSVVAPPLPQRFPFGRDNLKNILVRPFKFGMWVYVGKPRMLWFCDLDL